MTAAGLGAAAMLTGIAVGAKPAHAATAVSTRQRVVVIGGGIAGVATAWLLDGQHDVTLLEAAPSLGGHATSVPVDVDGHHVMVDIGAQFFGPYSHPIYNKLVTSVLQVPTVPNQLDNTVFQYGVPTPLMVSPSTDRPITDLLQYLPALQAVAELMDRARDLEARRDWSTTVADLVETMSVDETLKESFVYPYVASVNGATISQAKEFSARAALALAVRPLVNDKTEYVNARDGLQAVVSTLADEFTSVTTRVNTRAVALLRSGDCYEITDSQGRVHLADQVVLALPPSPPQRWWRNCPKPNRSSAPTAVFVTCRRESLSTETRSTCPLLQRTGLPSTSPATVSTARHRSPMRGCAVMSPCTRAGCCTGARSRSSSWPAWTSVIP